MIDDPAQARLLVVHQPALPSQIVIPAGTTRESPRPTAALILFVDPVLRIESERARTRIDESGRTSRTSARGRGTTIEVLRQGFSAKQIGRLSADIARDRNPTPDAIRAD